MKSRVVSRLLSDRRGAVKVEYIILVGVVAILAVSSWRLFGHTLWCKIQQQGSTVSQIGAETPQAPPGCEDLGGGVASPPTTPAAPPTTTETREKRKTD
jgi:Flp pilus assembly pilin Flp